MRCWSTRGPLHLLGSAVSDREPSPPQKRTRPRPRVVSDAMTHFDWPDRSSAELQRFAQDAARELALRIPGFPYFLLRKASQLHPRQARKSEGCWAVARTDQYYTCVMSHCPPRKLRRWRIDFNDRLSDPFDMGLILCHELAHFIAVEMNLFAPSHGLLWAACCDALMLVMEMDADSLNEGTNWIFEVDDDERTRTFTRERITGEEHWRAVRARTLTLLAGLLEQTDKPVQYGTLKLAIHAAWAIYAPPKPKVTRRRGHSQLAG